LVSNCREGRILRRKWESGITFLNSAVSDAHKSKSIVWLRFWQNASRVFLGSIKKSTILIKLWREGRDIDKWLKLFNSYKR
jgi:hypothetical protein